MSRTPGAVERSTEDARSSRTIRRERRTRSESVRIVIPGSTGREQAGTSTREPASSTTHTRHTLTGVRVSRKQRVGTPMPRLRHASRMVTPAGTFTGAPSMRTSTAAGAGRGGGAGGRLGGGGLSNQIGFTSGSPPARAGRARTPPRWTRSGPARRWRHRA